MATTNLGSLRRRAREIHTFTDGNLDEKRSYETLRWLEMRAAGARFRLTRAFWCDLLAAQCERYIVEHGPPDD